MMRTWWCKAKQSPVWRFIKRAVARWAELDGGQRSAAFAFYLLLSLFPLVIVLVTAGSMFVEREVATRAVVALIYRFAPLTGEQEREAVIQIRGVLESRGKISLFAFPLLIWSALRFLRALIRTTNRIWHSPEYQWWKMPLKSLGLLGITVSAVLGGILIPVVARLVQKWLTPNLETPAWAFGLIFQIVPWFVLFYGLGMIYKLAPSRRTRFAEVWIGALVATVSIWVIGLLFLFQAANFARFNALYGALGGIVALLLWIYLSSCMCVFGVCLSAVHAEAAGHAPDRSGESRA